MTFIHGHSPVITSLLSLHRHKDSYTVPVPAVPVSSSETDVTVHQNLESFEIKRFPKPNFKVNILIAWTCRS